MILSDISLCLPPTPFPALARRRVWYSAALAATIKIGLAGFCAFSRVRCLAPPLKPMRLPNVRKPATAPVAGAHYPRFQKGAPHGLLHQQVHHAKFGDGEIVQQAETCVTVAFTAPFGEKHFLYPDAFAAFLTLCDPVQQRKMQQLLQERDAAGKPLAWRRSKPRKHGVPQQSRPLWP